MTDQTFRIDHVVTELYEDIPLLQYAGARPSGENFVDQNTRGIECQSMEFAQRRRVQPLPRKAAVRKSLVRQLICRLNE